jgi:hypothetical protein
VSLDGLAQDDAEGLYRQPSETPRTLIRSE